MTARLRNPVVALFRLWTVLRVVWTYGLSEFWTGKPSRDRRPRGERLRLALTQLGTVYIKFGQALSTRPDLLPPDIASQLNLLQDRVPPFSAKDAAARIEASLGKPLSELFLAFDPEPMASASVAQVHAARMALPEADGGALDVVVKVLRPDILPVIQKDLALLRLLAVLAERLHPRGKLIKPVAVVAEFEKTLLDELDLMREAGNAAQLRRNWLGSELIYHPMVFWDYTRPDVLVLERLYGHSVRELDHFRAQGVDFAVLAERGVEIFFKQVFRDNFFHADMHPGNIFVDIKNPKAPSYLALDFGIVGVLSAADQRYLAENFLAFFNRDYKRVAELHLESGWIPPHVRLEDFEGAIRTVCEPIFGRPIKDISFGFFLLRLFEVAQRYQYQVQPQLVLLQKTLLQVEGLGRQLYPDLDLWKSAKPIMEEWMKKRLAPSTAIARFRSQAPGLAESLPVLVETAIKRLEKGESLSGITRREWQGMAEEFAREQRRTRHTMLAGAAVIVGAVLCAAAPVQSIGAQVAAWVAFATAAFLLWRA